ncbi:MAG TPA: NAD-dependent epimerase/dehydratase family protein [Bacteroidetes bacterium]|nr:3 beta-hydroxysteroid dehydrogenase/Delta 5-->4-isomerase [bacterium BMS3Bbin04]HDO64517.1 NAD-dependent epimerase/dehydratase family protein [Bacteroidota bacterium]HEX03642.1 NAD-dependent epimerase/dehydratase family protein [Bacteroidota bacterium]
MPYKTLVLGGTGFIGHHIVRELLENGHSVRVMARPNRNRSLLEGMDVEIVDGDLSKTSTILAALEGCDALIHAAAYYPIFCFDPKKEAEFGRSQILRIQEALTRHPVERFVYISGPAAVGRYADGRPEDEDSPWPQIRMKSAYARVKREMQDLVLYNGKKHNAIVAAPGGVFGPGDRKPTSGRVIVDIAKNHMPIALRGRANAASVFAVAEGIRLALEKGKVGRLYVLGQENLTIPDLMKRMAKITGGTSPKITLSPEFVRPQLLIAERLAFHAGKPAPLMPLIAADFALFGEYMSSDVAKAELGYDPSKYPLDEALKQAYEWFKEKGMV